MPCAPKIKEKHSHEYIAQTEWQRIFECPHPVADKRASKHDDCLQNRNGLDNVNFLNQMHQNVGGEEREQKPNRLISPKRTCFPQMTPLHRFYRMVVAVNLERKENSIDDEAYCSPCNVWNEQSFCLILDVGFSVSRYGLIEIACLEEKEAHEEERPRHDLSPPVVTLMATKGDSVQAYHSDDADAAEEVESVVTLLHFSCLIVSLSSVIRSM